MKKIILVLSLVFMMGCALENEYVSRERQYDYTYTQIEIRNIVQLDEEGNVITSIFIDYKGNIITDDIKINEILNNIENKYIVLTVYI